ncbi:MAG: hypothetical protein II830_00160, partial [Alphaproteobacteria bacterium]|nr:hypothetical protein [Alphaproteobacteria bacterium]
MFNNNQDETTRQTLERVMREMGLYKEPKIMHTEIGDFHVYDDDDSISNGNMTSSVVNQNVPSYNTQNAYYGGDYIPQKRYGKQTRSQFPDINDLEKYTFNKSFYREND